MIFLKKIKFINLKLIIFKVLLKDFNFFGWLQFEYITNGFLKILHNHIEEKDLKFLKNWTYILHNKN
jgi:hypothetical protein